MIKCNLAVLLAERNIKISELSKRTGISRTTLTALAQNHSKGIQFDTFDTLCSYLKIYPNELFIQEVLEYDFTVIDITQVRSYPQLVCDLSLNAEIKYKSQEFNEIIACRVQLYNSTVSNIEIDTMSVSIVYPESILEIINSIPITFRTSLEEELVETIKPEIILRYNLNEDIDTHLI